MGVAEKQYLLFIKLLILIVFRIFRIPNYVMKSDDAGECQKCDFYLLYKNKSKTHLYNNSFQTEPNNIMKRFQTTT